MFLSVECPAELSGEMSLPPVMTSPAVLLEAAEEVPAGPWLGALLAGIDVTQLSDFDLPAYLRAGAKLQAWSAGMLADGVAELAARPGGFGADKEVSLALREPVGAAQRRIHDATRLRRLFPRTRRLGRAGASGEKHVQAIVDATGRVDDPQLLAAVEDSVLGGPRALAKTPSELRRAVRAALTRLD